MFKKSPGFILVAIALIAILGCPSAKKATKKIEQEKIMVKNVYLSLEEFDELLQKQISTSAMKAILFEKYADSEMRAEMDRLNSDYKQKIRDLEAKIAELEKARQASLNVRTPARKVVASLYSFFSNSAEGSQATKKVPVIFEWNEEGDPEFTITNKQTGRSLNYELKKESEYQGLECKSAIVDLFPGEYTIQMEVHHRGSITGGIISARKFPPRNFFVFANPIFEISGQKVYAQTTN